jgi:molybdopterin synthase catalytic subunit
MHRGDAFHSAEFLMDYLKTRAPFWKKEITPNGDIWIDAKIEDQNAADKWNQNL